ncbi:diacylglycerol kinase [Aurantiacibacter atlanticus]|uniref:Diacylglycerol kinase n=1 Tax=Aurantiacibacter atlanticus TaxID=1648404 RepID=A0A0H4V8U5_9SPHN|nr:diacylglycerol kinase family protein [Aurantiacibacter atlanticus]AKQ41032.1 diacylglycerol kinase [Aurantiacibacter atlanticus]MDF1833555.1 diacylglycerol kinase family protein [Alteraurantiacibacter sp. bin_em_oilr2.035]
MQGSIHLFERMPEVEARPGADDERALMPLRARPLVGLIRNARSHRNHGGDGAHQVPEGVIVTAPGKRSDLPGILADFAERRVDCIAIDGGDGTVRDVLTCGAGIFGESWPMVIVLPNGKTNALAQDLGILSAWTLEEALAAAKLGHIVRRQPLVIAERENESAQVRGFIMGAGAFNRCIALGQKSHKLGAFNAAVVGVTAGWSVLQALLGASSNPWRRGTPIRVRLGDGEELTHLGGLPQDERYLLVATTLEGFPAGLNPFRSVIEPLRLAVMDNPRRGLLLRIGALMRGTASEATLQRGAHVLGTETIDLDLSDSFILDGEAFPAGNYRVTAGSKLRFVVP